MKHTFEKAAAEELKEVEQTIRSLSDRRLILKSLLEQVKGKRPIGHVEAPVKKMFSPKFAENESMASRINFILAKQSEPLTSAEVTKKYTELVPEAGGKKKYPGTLKNISTILSIGTGKKYDREKPEAEKKFRYRLMKQAQLA